MDSKSALTCIVPDLSQIQAIRKKYDTAYSRWMPHFNIDCFPFFPQSQHAELSTKIQEVCARFAPINITLAKLKFFGCTSKRPGTLYVEVEEESGMLSKLRFEILSKLGLTPKSVFTPHITLGRFNKQDQLENVLHSLHWEPVTFTLDGLHLIIRDDNSPFEKSYFFPFGKSNPEYLKELVIDEISEEYSAIVCNVDDYYIFKLNSLHTVERVTNPAIVNCLVIDNSGSMGSATKSATNIIGKGMYRLSSEYIDVMPGEVLLFSDNVDYYEDIRTEKDFDRIRFPSQGCTNITKAILVSVNRIVQHKQKSGSNYHYIMTFLSDGMHNEGPELTAADFIGMKNSLFENQVSLSIIVVGISNSDTRLGMKIKTELETVNINSLDSVYHARNFSEMNTTLDKLLDGCSKYLCSGEPVDLSLKNGIFIENNSVRMKNFFSNDNVIAVKSTNGIIPTLRANGKSIRTQTRNVDYVDVSTVIDYLLPRLSQLKIAFGTKSIENKILILEGFIMAAESLFKRLNNPVENLEIGNHKLSAGKRLAWLKHVRTSQMLFQEERNKLKMLQITVANDSAKQAEYLTGFNKKYSAKAVLRCNTISLSLNDVLLQLNDLKPQLEMALANDKGGDDDDHSLISLNTSMEQHEEWLTYDTNQFTDIYSLLVYFGFSCYPVKFEHNNAVQMDPFQTNCQFIEPYLMDTSTLMLANQTDKVLNTPSRKQFTDGLILINPSTVHSSLLLRKTYIYQYLCSITLCRDLYMYHPRMSYAMHAHALKRCIEEFFGTGSKAYIELALKIVYSFKLTGDKDVGLFNRWWNNWETITQSAEDNCHHPVQLLMMLTSLNMESAENYQVPLINLLNEVLARKAKIILSQHDNSTNYAFTLMQKLFGINDSNSPTPNPDVLTPEPSILSVKENCQLWARVEDVSVLQDVFGADSVEEYINRTLLPYVQTFHFAILLQKNDSWEQDFLSKNDDLLSDLSRDLSEITDVFTYLGQPKSIANTMLLQSTLNHTSQTRTGIANKNVFDPITLNDLIVDLRMAVYFDLCKIKREKWTQIIGDVTFHDAYNADIDVFTSMIGLHTHGLNKKKFWAMLRASLNDCDKLDVFRKKSGSNVSACIIKERNRAKT